MEANKTNKRYKLNFKKLIILVLFLYLLGSGLYYFVNRPIKNIIIEGNYLISDADIIRAAGIEDYPSMLRLSSRKLEENIKELGIINSVQIRRDYRYRLTIEIDEAKVILYNQINNQLLLSNGNYIENSNELMGIPALINFAPENILKDFALRLGTLDYEVLSLISEIEYSPMQNIEGATVDETRFILYMNDGNHVYINTASAENLSHYITIYAALEGRIGIIYLDSNNNLVFSSFESMSSSNE